MKNRKWSMLLFGAVLFTFVLIVGRAPSATAVSIPQSEANLSGTADVFDRLAQDSAGTADVAMHGATGVARFVTFSAGMELAGADAATQADNFLKTYGAAFGIQDAVTELVQDGVVVDRFGFTHVSYAQVHEGVAVFGGVMRIHFNAGGRVTAVNGTFIPKIKTSATPRLTATAANDIGIAAVRAQNSASLVASFEASKLEAAATDLLYYHTGLIEGKTGDTLLTYRVEVSNGANIREFVFVNAQSGAIAEQISGIHDALDRKVYESNSIDPPKWEDSEGDPDPITAGWEGGTAQQVTDWQNEIDGAKETYNVINNMAGYASYDGADATMITVNNDPGISCPNANWNGTSTNYCSGVTGDDTVAHEWGHAYTEYTHGLVYAWQPGALNESYSDIWGEIVDLVNGRGSDDAGTRTDGSCADAAHDPTGGPHGPDTSYRWLSGEDDPAFGGAIRDMWSPQCHGDPGKVSDAVYHCASSDSGGVHTNSGVPNHAFALLVDGGTYNGQTISGIGLDKAAYIYWRAQSVYQGVASDFADHATSLAASCSDLTGNATLTGLSATGTPGAVIPAITAGDCAELAKVVTAVEFNTPPTQCGFTPAFVAAPALCAGQGTGAVESINSQDWESGIGSWTFDTHDIAIPGTFTNPDWTIVGSLPAGEAGDAMYVEDSINRGACTAADSVAGALNLDSPSILIPAGADIPRVAIDHYVAIESGWDGGNLKISVNGGAWTVVPNSAFEVNGYFAPGAINGGSNDNPLGGEEGWTGGGEGQVATGWGQSQINLLGIAAAGDTIQLRFDMGLDGCNGVDGWYVDEVQVYSCEDEIAGAACGNGLLNIGETCDDGNTANGDGCSNTCLVEDGWSCTDPVPGDPNGTNMIADSSFEGGTPNADWTATSTFGGVAGFPICDAASCVGVDFPNTGSWFLWMGGLDVVTSSVAQTVTIPATATDMTVEAFVAFCADPDATFEVTIDGTSELLLDCMGATDGGYVTRTIDVSSYADGGTHALKLEGIVPTVDPDPGDGIPYHSNIFVDDVVLYDNVSAGGTPSVCTAFPNISAPSQVQTTQVPGKMSSKDFVINNQGAAALNWTIAEDAAFPFAPARAVTTHGLDATAVNQLSSGDFGFSADSNGNGERVIPQSVEKSLALTTITHSASQAIVAANSVSCNVGGLHANNGYMRTFDLAAFGISGDFDVTEVEFGVETAASGSGGAQPITVNLYTMINPAAPLTFANLSLIGTTSTTVVDQTSTLVTIPVVGTAPAGSVLAVEIFTPNGQTDGHAFFMGSNPDGQTAPSYLIAADCGATEPTDTAALGAAGMHIVMNVTGDATATACDAPSDIPWASVSPASGTTAPFSSDNVTVTFDSTGLAVGSYSGTLCVDSNDPDEPLVEVVVTLDVVSGFVIDLPIIMKN